MKQKNSSDVISYQTVKNDKSFAQFGDWEKRRKPNIYIIYDLPDQLLVKEVKNFLTKEDYFVIEPDFKGTLIDRRTHHVNNLIIADIILIYYGRENTLWLRTKLLDILKSPGLGRIKPLPECVVYAMKDVKVIHESVLKYQVTLISQDDIFPPKLLTEFLNKVIKSYAAVSE
jgi:hypothetical protein